LGESFEQVVVCMFSYITDLHTVELTDTSTVEVRWDMYIYTHVYICIYIYTYISVYTYKNIYIHIYMFIFVYFGLCVFMHACVVCAYVLNV